MTYTEFHIPSPSVFSFQLSAVGRYGDREIILGLLGNSFILNTTFSFNVTVWCLTTLTVSDSNILGYASPLQQVSIVIQLTANGTVLADRHLLINYIDQQIDADYITRSDGTIMLSITAPDTDGTYTLSVTFSGYSEFYELPSSIHFVFQVDSMMPIQVSLDRYEPDIVQKTILVEFRILALNGTYLDNLHFNYEWEGIMGKAVSQTGGQILLQLQIPLDSGVHMLSLELLHDEYKLRPFSYVFLIIIDPTESNMAEGIGFYGVLAGFIGSLVAAAIPVLLRRNDLN
jgi:hypothetical protein